MVRPHGGQTSRGMSMEGRTLRWRPGPGQRGEYGINLIVSDGELESCQLMKMTVVGPEMAVSGPLTAPPPANPQAATGNPQSTYAGWAGCRGRWTGSSMDSPRA